MKFLLLMFTCVTFLTAKTIDVSFTSNANGFILIDNENVGLISNTAPTILALKVDKEYCINIMPILDEQYFDTSFCTTFSESNNSSTIKLTHNKSYNPEKSRYKTSMLQNLKGVIYECIMFEDYIEMISRDFPELTEEVNLLGAKFKSAYGSALDVLKKDYALLLGNNSDGYMKALHLSLAKDFKEKITNIDIAKSVLNGVRQAINGRFMVPNASELLSSSAFRIEPLDCYVSKPAVTFTTANSKFPYKIELTFGVPSHWQIIPLAPDNTVYSFSSIGMGKEGAGIYFVDMENELISAGLDKKDVKRNLKNPEYQKSLIENIQEEDIKAQYAEMMNDITDIVKISSNVSGFPATTHNFNATLKKNGAKIKYYLTHIQVGKYTACFTFFLTKFDYETVEDFLSRIERYKPFQDKLLESFVITQ